MSAMLDYMQLCRLCLVKEKVNVPIFDEQSDVRQIYLKISACLPVKISRDDSLPKNICDSCCYKVDLLYQFWNTTVNAEKQLTEWLGNLGVDISKTAGTTSAQHSTPAESIVLKQENHDPPEVQNVEQIPEFLPSTQIYTNYNQQFASSNVPNDNLNSSVNNEPAKVKRRGRPPGSTKKKPPPATQTSTNTEDESNDEGSTLNEPDLEDSDESMEDGKRIAKEEQESDLEYEENEALEPTTFVGVTSETPCDTEQPGPSGLNKPATITASEAGYVTILQDDGKLVGVLCKLCKKIYSDHDKYRSHNGKVHREKCVECPTCGKMFRFKYYLENHLINFHKKDVLKPHKCEFCDQSFTQPCYLRRHLKQHSQRFTCDICNKEYSTRQSLEGHKAVQHEGKRFKCEHCKQIFKCETYFKEHVKMHDPLRTKRVRIKKKSEIICELCGKMLTSLFSYHLHMRIHREEKPFLCSTCGAKFSSKEVLNVHNRLHLGVKPYSCDVCGKNFRQTISLKIHRRYHTGERPYKCQYCDKSFVCKSSLTGHIKTH